MIKTLIWATDGSDAADVALVHAKALMADGDWQLVAAHCEELLHPGGSPGHFPVHADEGELLRKIERQVNELAGEGITARLRVVSSGASGAAHEIADLAREERAAVIVTGVRGPTARAAATPPGRLVGSVTARLLEIAPCPVLAVPTGHALQGPDHHAEPKAQPPTVSTSRGATSSVSTPRGVTSTGALAAPSSPADTLPRRT